MTWTPDKVEALAKELPKHANLIFVEIDNPVISGSAYKIIKDAASALTWALERIAAVEKDEQDAIKQRDQQYGRAEVAIEERDAANARADEARNKALDQAAGYAYCHSAVGQEISDGIIALKEAGK
jgi:hypothetical protein